MFGRMRRAMFLPAAVLFLVAAGCGVSGEGSSTTFPAMGTTVQLPPQNVVVSAPDGDGPVTAVVWGTSGQFDTAPLLAVDGSGRTLAYGVWSGDVLDVSVCPGSTKIVALGNQLYDPQRVVSVWDLARLEVEDTWRVDGRAWSVRCVSSDGRRSVLYLQPAGMDPSPPTSAGPATTVPAPVGEPPAGSNSWSIVEVDHGVVSTLFDPGEYGHVLAFTSRWAIASHNATLWIVDLAERPPHATVLETTFHTTAAIDPSGSFVVVAGQYPNTRDPVDLSLFRFGPEPTLVAQATEDGSAWTDPFVWLDPDRFVRGTVVYDRDLDRVDTWSVLLRRLAVGRSAAFGTESIEQWKQVFVVVDVNTGGISPVQKLTGSTQGIAVVDDGPVVTDDAYRRVPEPTIPTSPHAPVETVPETLVSLPRLGAVDGSDLQEFRDLAVAAGSDADRILAKMSDLADGQTAPVSMREIDGCSGVGFAAGASSSQPLGQAEIAGRSVIVYAFANAEDVTVAAIDPTNCEILDTAGPLLTPGPGVNITTTITVP